MFSAERLEDNILNEKIHEHDFILIKTEKSVCSTCGLLYCENCGKAVNEPKNLGLFL